MNRRRKRRKRRTFYDNPRYFGYTRVSKADNRVIREIRPDYEPPERPGEASLLRQEKAIRSWAERECVDIERVFFDEGISGREVPWSQRPGFLEMLDTLEDGDHVVVWRLDRLDRGPGGMVAALRHLQSEKDVVVHAIQEAGGQGIDLDTLQGNAVAEVYSLLASLDAVQRRATAVEVSEYCRRIGRKYCNHPGFGRTFVEREDPVTGERHEWIVWDQDECAKIKELHRRVEVQGESLYRVALDLHNRQGGKPCKHGGVWVNFTPRSIRRKDQGHPNRARRALKWYKNILAAGGDIGYGDGLSTQEAEDLVKAFQLPVVSLDEVCLDWGLTFEEACDILDSDSSLPKKLRQKRKRKPPQATGRTEVRPQRIGRRREC